ncbi:T9SS sorting signal type C domain-containing protein [Flavobacterium sp. UBA7663]|uniref:T9SS sorting signal type C domain-containing protein n=1 Tax=Flavobacterium sp. UBA7663 TaxID=1946557 RepID=UPI0025C401A9|nr:T9SS sorting signal type C domain-containing protein [Flavobacterium sp. UBA7663]
MKKNYATKILIALTFLFFQLSFSQTTTWTGASWDNGVPTITVDAIIASGTCTITVNTEAKSIIVQSGATLSIQSSSTITVENDIQVLGTGKFIVRNNCSLVQNNPSAVNTGSIEYRRNAEPMIQYDYTYWSSPVAGQVLNVFSPLTLGDKFFTFNATTNTWVIENQANTMQIGKGYAIRAPQGYNSTAQVFNGIFEGVPNNGDYTQNVVAWDPILGNYNLLGNPYPSALDTRDLIDNSSINTLYYWTHNTAIASNVFTANDYAVRTRTAGTAASSGGVVPNRYMAAGQGFFARSSSTGTVTFTNAMRQAGNNGRFFRSSSQNETFDEEDDNLIRLDLSNSGGAFKQQVVQYLTDATNGYDVGVDGEQIDGVFVSFYSIIPGHTLAIQARELPWNIDDQVVFGFKSTINAVTSFEISISELGIFFNDKDVFLEDKVTNTFHDLKVSPYTFSSNMGLFEDRFVLHYKNLLLSNNDFIGIENSVYLFNENKLPKMVSTKSNIASIIAYDMLGRVVFSKDNINASEVSLSGLINNNQALLIKATLENNITVVKKFIF